MRSRNRYSIRLMPKCINKSMRSHLLLLGDDRVHNRLCILCKWERQWNQAGSWHQVFPRDESTTTWYLNNHASITLETSSKLTGTTRRTNRYQNPQGGSYSCGLPIGGTGTWHRRGEIGKAWRHKKTTLQHNSLETIRIELQFAT